MQKQTNAASNVILSISLFSVLLSIYYLTYTGTYITDDEHILASRTLSAAYDPVINDNRVLGNSRVFSYSLSEQVDSSQGLNVEPVQAYLGSFLAKIAVPLNIGHVQSIFLLNIFLTAATAVLVFWIITFSGYSKLTSYTLGILFGLCTIVWPYTRTYFRDTVAMFFLTLSWGTLLVITSERLRNHRIKFIRPGYWMIFLLSLCLGILSKNSVLIAIPVFLAVILSKGVISNTAFDFKIELKSKLIKVFIAFSILLFIIFIWVILLPKTGIFSRFTLSYYHTVLQNFIRNPHPHLIQAILGPIISPGKSIFLFSPILFLSLFSLIKFFRQAWSAWLYFFLLVIGQGLFYDSDWWGHVNWGLRFIIPTIPLLIIASAPIVENLLGTRQGQLKLFLLGSFSLFFQLIGILAPVKQYYIALTNSAPTVTNTSAIWNPKYTAIWWHLKWIFSGGLSDLAISRIGMWSIPLTSSLLILIFFSLALTRGRYRLRHAVMILFISIMSSGILLSIYRFDPANHLRKDLTESQITIQDNYLQNDIILIKSYGTQAWSFWMNWGDPELKWISLPYFFPTQFSIEKYSFSDNPTEAPNDISQRIIRTAVVEYNRVWLVLPADSPGGNLNWEVDYLTQDEKMIKNWVFFGDGYSTLLYLFDTNRK